jgi:hypothetical protein
MLTSVLVVLPETARLVVLFVSAEEWRHRARPKEVFFLCEEEEAQTVLLAVMLSSLVEMRFRRMEATSVW